MAKNVRKIAQALGAKVVGKTSDTGPGAFGAAKLAAVLRSRLAPSEGVRPGRPTDPSWIKHPKVPMSERTLKRLECLATLCSTPRRKISPMQVAAQVLENSVKQLAEARK